MMGRGCVWLGRGGACMAEEWVHGEGGMRGWGWGGACVVWQGATHAPHTVGKRAVRILLECCLVHSKKEVPFNCKSLKYKYCQVWLLHCSYFTCFQRKCWETEVKIGMKSHIRHCLQSIYIQLHYIKHTQYLVWAIMEEFLIIYIVRAPLPTHSKMELRSRTILVWHRCQGYHLKSFNSYIWPKILVQKETAHGVCKHYESESVFVFIYIVQSWFVLWSVL